MLCIRSITSVPERSPLRSAQIGPHKQSQKIGSDAASDHVEGCQTTAPNMRFRHNDRKTMISIL